MTYLGWFVVVVVATLLLTGLGAAWAEHRSCVRERRDPTVVEPRHFEILAPSELIDGRAKGWVE